MYLIANHNELLNLGLKETVKYELVPYTDGSDYIAVMRADEYAYFKLLIESNNPTYAKRKSGIPRGVCDLLHADPVFKGLITQYMGSRVITRKMTPEYILDKMDRMMKGHEDLNKLPVLKALWEMVGKKRKSQQLPAEAEKEPVEWGEPKVDDGNGDK